MTSATAESYEPTKEARRILNTLLGLFPASSLALPEVVKGDLQQNVRFVGTREYPLFPVPFKETETTAALKALEGLVATALAGGRSEKTPKDLSVKIDLDKSSAFLFSAYLTTVGGYSKAQKESKLYLKDTDVLQAQSIPYRRMSANLYETKDVGSYYHIHGSLEASSTLNMIGLEPYHPDLETHEQIVDVIESAVKKFSVKELEEMNGERRQAGSPALKYEDFVETQHGRSNVSLPPWDVTAIETDTKPAPLPQPEGRRLLAGVKVLELCRVIAGPTIGRILAEYGADVLKVTGRNQADVPFFQVDVNMGKHTTALDLKQDDDRATFESLLAEADVILDGYRPGAIEKLGYGRSKFAEVAKARGKGMVYVNENCFGYQGEWSHRAGWQQIADCISGVAWGQGRFMGLNEPVVPPFPISDYGTGCMGAIAALTGLYHRSVSGGSYHAMVSLLQYDLLLFRVGLYPEHIQEHLRKAVGSEFLALRHSHSVDQISSTALRSIKKNYPDFFEREDLVEKWHSSKFGAPVVVVSPVVEIDGLDLGFERASRPNDSDLPTWNFGKDTDYRIGSTTPQV